MSIDRVAERYIPKDNHFFQNYYHIVLICLCAFLGFLILVSGVVFYQIIHKALPDFLAIQPDGKKMSLIAFHEPNMLSSTLLQWASKAAVASYTFDFVNYNKEVAALRSYFTEDGWRDYLQKINPVLATVKQNQLFVNGVVAGTPVISNEGPLPGKDYVWRVQIPFLVTYQTANIATQQKFTVLVTIVKMTPSDSNPQGIGIDQFVMV